MRAVEPSLPPLDPRWDGQLLPLISRDFPIAVCWSAKSGCTTILKWFLAHNGLLEKALAYSSWVHDYREQRLCAGHDYRWQCERLFSHDRSKTFIVKVIRDPAKRAVSSFLHFLRWEHNEGWAAGAAVASWKQAMGLGTQPGLSFRQFLHFIADKQRHGRTIDPHFRPQYEPLQDPQVHAHIQLEHLCDTLPDLERRFCWPHVDVRKLSESGHHNPPSRHSDWPTLAATCPAELKTLTMLGTPSAEAFLDSETFALVRKVYRDDYAAYGSMYPPMLSMEDEIRRPKSTNARFTCGGMIPRCRSHFDPLDNETALKLEACLQTP